MATPLENHAAAGSVASTARGEVKADWWKKPVALHVAIATGVIGTALIINFSIEFNFFWKLLFGGGLVWVGTKMAGVKMIPPVKLWGRIFVALGWAVIIVSLLNSGFRMYLERAVNRAEQSLAESASKTKMMVDLRRLAYGDSETVLVGENDVAIVQMAYTLVGSGFVNFVCIGTPVGIKLANLYGSGTGAIGYALDQASIEKLAGTKASVSFILTKKPENGPADCTNIYP